MAANQKQIRLHYISDNPIRRRFAAEYWSGSWDINNRWVWNESVQDVGDRYRLLKKDVISTVRSIAYAIDESVSCSRCQQHKELTSRSAFTSKSYTGFLCEACQQEMIAERERERIATEEARVLRQRSVIIDLSEDQSPYEYSAIGYFDAVLLYSIMLASDKACENGKFSDSQHLHLCPSRSLSNKLLERLRNKGILHVDENTHENAVELGEGAAYQYFPDRAKWRVAADFDERSFPQIMSFLGQTVDRRQGHAQFTKAVEKLWRLLGYDDALACLLREVDTYRLPDFRPGPKTDEAIWHALEHFSIPQVRREIVSVVKNAAALSQNRNFARRHALNTIPGNLISYTDRAVSEGWQVYPLLSDWQNGEPILLTVLFNRVLGTGLTGFKALNGKSVESSDTT